MFRAKLARIREEKGDDASFDLNYGDAAAKPGSARSAPRAKKTYSENLIDTQLPSLTGIVIDVTPMGEYKKSKITLGVTSVHTPVSCRHVVELPNSKTVVQLGIGRWANPDNKKVAIPHYFDKLPHLVELDGIVTIDVADAKNGPLGTDLKPGSYPLGTKLMVSNVVFELKLHKGRYNAWGQGVSVTQLEEAAPIPGRIGSAIERLAMGSAGLQRLAGHGFARMASEPLFAEDVKKDAAFLADTYEKIIEDFRDAIVKADDGIELPMIEDVGSILAKVAALREFKGTAMADLHDLFDPDRASKTAFSGSTKVVTPVFQMGSSPVDSIFMQRDETSVGTFGFDLTSSTKEESDAFWTDKKVLGEAVLKPNYMKLDYDPTVSIGAFWMDTVAVNIMTKNDDGWRIHTPKIADGTTAFAVKQLLFSAKNGKIFDVKNLLGVYDFGRMPGVFNTLIPYASVFFPLAKTAPVSGKASPIENPMLEGDWAAGTPLIDFYGAIKSVGVAVSEKFLVDFIWDEMDECAKVPDEPIQYVENESDGKTPLEPKPPKLATNGYLPLNTVPEFNFKPKLKTDKLAPGQSIVFRAVFKGCDDLTKNTSVNTDPAAGEAALKEHFQTADVAELSEKLRKDVVVYALLVQAEPKLEAENVAAN
jgi:hypothetical protein